MPISPMSLRFGTVLTVDQHPMTQRELAKWPAESHSGLEQAKALLAADGNPGDTLNLYYADDMVGQADGFEPNYLGFELNGGYPPETLPLFKLHHLTEPAKVVEVVKEALHKLKKRAESSGYMG